MEELAALCPGKYNYQTIQRLETGGQRLTEIHMQRIAIGLGIHPFELMKAAPGTVGISELVSLDDMERDILRGFRSLTEEGRRRLYNILQAAEPDAFKKA